MAALLAGIDPGGCYSWNWHPIGKKEYNIFRNVFIRSIAQMLP